MDENISGLALRISQAMNQVRQNLVDRLQAPIGQSYLNADHIVSNSVLMMETLDSFYRDSQSTFFPATVTNEIRTRLGQVESSFSNLPADIPVNTASDFLVLLDTFYAYCMQYGLITFGFTGKAAQEKVENIQRSSQLVRSVVNEFFEKTKQSEVELADLIMVRKKETEDQIASLQPSIQELSNLLSASQKDSAAVGESLKSSTEKSLAMEKIQAELESTSHAVVTELESKKTSAAAELEAIQAAGKRSQELEADAKAKNQAVTDARASIKDQMTAITEFYGEIEKHVSQMTDARKDSQANLSSLQEKSEKAIASIRSRSDVVVATNEKLITEIKDKLRKAIGISLFTAFNNRRRHISWASWIWGVILLGSVGGTIWYAIWFVTHLAELAKSDIHPALVYGRLIIVAPLAFLVAFTAKRYSSERRAEEEYAFKSAISVSLDSYRELIARMKTEKQDTAFVEKLILEIFDNPTKRLYGSPKQKEKDEEDGTDMIGLVKTAMDKIPNAE